MEEFLLIPTALNLSEFSILVVLSLFTSMLTASLGIGGGVLLLAIMAQFLPVKALVPVHGVVQLGSNTGRAILMAQQVATNQLTWFVSGSLLGAIIGGNLVVSLPTHLMQLILGGYILYSTWRPKPKTNNVSLPRLGITGLLSTFLTMFVAATGPFVMASLRSLSAAPQGLVATHAACMVVQHLLKVIVFGFLGFVFSDYFGLILAMIATGFIGTIIGRKILLKADAEKFKNALNLILTLLAIKLIYTAISSFL